MMAPSPPPISPLPSIIAAQSAATNAHVTLNVIRRGDILGRVLVIGWMLYIVAASGALGFATVVCAQSVMR